MADFKLVVSDPKTAKAYNIDVTGPRTAKLVGKAIGAEVDGEAVGLTGYTLVITGGSDKDGVPMRKDLPGQGRRRVLVAGGVGYHPKSDGMRKRKTLRGNEISGDLVQVNAVVKSYGPKPLEELVPKTEGAGKKKKEEKKKAAAEAKK
ncbi:SSU ribosomal protein S6E [Methanocella conradii HZ254]|uniref:Small ribosomal subunit protein eS6 n=1 Tax=Methanocella conradii (strain DSM 24694 / JCM 17849 / CGMCC 1.5162 / HZ254) TaxID=1041930 RepID=H8IAM3_METCZ|nr:30S ribosomal protein S6e [Methanocella conradii]AFD00120.1 SSU ribosomal protein S6E [Methanocella conradii HZ254]MDI6896060.1 30S ribosomal protein S6e [Methanocella conradii]